MNNIEVDQKRKVDALTLAMAQVLRVGEIVPRYNLLQLPEPQKTPEDVAKALYFDVSKFDVDDLTKILAENRLDELKNKIAPFDLIIDKYGFPQYEIDTSTPLGKLEVYALYDTKKLVEEHDQKVIVWMSPRGGNSPYLKERINILILKEKRADGSLVFESRAICCDYGREEFLRIGQEMKYQDGGKSLSILEEPDDLRPHPIGLNLKDQNVWDYLQDKFMGLDKVWETIRYGVDLINDKDNRMVAEDVKNVFSERIKEVKTYQEKVILGAEIEEYILSKHGISLVQTGGHGSSNTAMLNAFGGLKTAFNVLAANSTHVTKETPGAKDCPVCKVPYVGTCDACGYSDYEAN